MTHESALQFAGQFWDHVSTSMYITLCVVVWVLRNGQRMLRKLPMPFEWKHFDARAARHDRWRIYFQSLHQSAECMHTVSVTPSSSFNPCKYFIVTVINTCPENGAVVGTAIIQFALHLTSAANQCNGQVILQGDCKCMRLSSKLPQPSGAHRGFGSLSGGDLLQPGPHLQAASEDKTDQQNK